MLSRSFRIKKQKESLTTYNKFFIFNKSQSVLKLFLGFYINIYKGNLYRRLIVNKYLIGYKFGQFTHTRKPYTYVLKKNVSNNLRR